MAELLPLETAREQVLARIAGPLGAETLPVADALDRVLAAPVIARVALPPFDNSAMDGYAIRAVDIATATDADPVRLAVVGESRAGAGGSATVEPGTAIRIATGAPLPPGADAIVQVELTTPVAADGTTGVRGRDATGPLPAACLVHSPVPLGASIRRRGEDVREGDVIAAAGRAVSPPVVALAAGSGNPMVSVHRQPRVAIVATGDEVRPAGDPLPPGCLPDANGPGLGALVAAAGGVPIRLGIAPDRLETVVARLLEGIATADVVIVSGGVSVGPYDVVKHAFEAIGRIDLWRVAVQPGKPFAFGEASAADGRTVLLFGLPGNPVSSFVTFELFVRPTLRMLAGLERLVRTEERAILAEPVGSSAGRRTFVRVVADRHPDGRVRRDEQGRATVRPAGGQGSHVLSALVAAEAFAIIPEAVLEAAAGDEVGLWWLDD